MVLTRQMKAKGITFEDKQAANVLVQLNKDNAILKQLKDDMEHKEYLYKLKREREKKEIIKQIKIWTSAKDKFVNVINECNKEVEYIDVELAKIISELDNL